MCFMNESSDKPTCPPYVQPLDTILFSTGILPVALEASGNHRFCLHHTPFIFSQPPGPSGFSYCAAGRAVVEF